MSLVVVDESKPHVSILTLNRPEKRNALSIELMEALLEAVTAASRQPGRRAIILRGEGKGFCAGLDLNEAYTPALTTRSSEALASLHRAIVESPLVTIAAVQGPVFGGGVGLLAACDLAVAGDDLRIGFPEVRRGLVAALVTALLRRQVPERNLRELILLSRTVEPDEALALGLVNRVVPVVRLLDEATEMARAVSYGAPGAVARTKRLLDELASRPVAQDIELALRYHLEARHSNESAEGVRAFLEKRPPAWAPPEEPR